MGVKVKGDCFCPGCDKPVAAQKSTHRFRNIASTILLPNTLGLSAAGYAKGAWHCPDCGGAVRDLRAEQAQQQSAALTTWINTHPKLLCVIAVGTLILAAVADL